MALVLSRRIRLLMLLCVSGLPFGVSAQNDLVISEAWIREPPPVAKVAAGYMHIQNNRDEDVVIVTVHASVAEKSEIHEMRMHDDMMQMAKLPHLKIASSEQVTLEPGGLHIMLMQLLEPLKQGDNVELTLQLENGEQITLQAPVKRAH